MASTRGRPSNRAKAARALSSKELSKEFQFESSNSTTAAFLGGKQKDWMSGQMPAGIRRPSVAALPSPISPSIEMTASPEVWFTADKDNSIKSYDFSKVPFPPDFDRGRFPLQRRRRGGTKIFPGRPATDLRTPSVPSSPRSKANLPQITSTEGIYNANPSPPPSSPSVETRRQSITIVDLEDAMMEPQATEGSPRTTLTRLNTEHGAGGFEKRPDDLNQTKSLSQSRTNPTPVSAPSRTHPHGPTPSRQNSIHSESATSLVAQSSNRTASRTSKRPSKDMSDSRKRLQSLHEPAAGQPESRFTTTEDVAKEVGSNVPSLETEMEEFLQKVLERLATADVLNRPGRGPEQPRLGLLREACERSDCFYLCLHQLYCLNYKYGNSGIPMIPLHESHCTGLVVLTDVLVSNQELFTDALDWFINFPIPLCDLLMGRPAFQAAYQQVLRCLPLLASNWGRMNTQCKQRGYPPLVEELIVLFDVHSFTIQQVIFRALLRKIWRNPHDQCFQWAEELFSRSYQEVLRRKSMNPPEFAHEAHARTFIYDFQQIVSFHQSHVQQTLISNVPPPPQNRLSATTIERHRQEDPRSLSLSIKPHATQQSAGPSSSTPTVLHSATALQPTPGSRSTLVHSSNESMAPNGSSSPQSAASSLPPAAIHHPEYHGIHNIGNDQALICQLMESRNLAGRLHPASNLPSTLVERRLQPIPQEFIAHRISQSNSPGRGVTHVQQENWVPQQPGQVQLPAPRRQLRSPGLTEIQDEAHNRRPERPYRTQTPQKYCTRFVQANPNIDQSQPNPALNALHQSHVKRPILYSFDVEGRPVNMSTLFRYIRHVIMPPGEISSVKRYLGWEFNVSKEVTVTFVRNKPGSYGSPPTRVLFPGNRLCRIRCINISTAAQLPSLDEWVVADNTWPSGTAIVLNGEPLEIRRKSHHGKDLPIDVTALIKEGNNTIATSIIGLTEGSVSRYAIGVEIVEVTQDHLIRNSMKTVPWHQARQRIIDQSGNLDPDVQVVSSQMVLDLTDPFMAHIFQVPVRGDSCRHNKCFDRDVFLQTRNSKNKKEPCGPDEFRCPICGADARPQKLIIDGFFVKVREELEKQGRLDVKAITFNPNNGEWEIKEEEEATGEQGDGSGIKNRTSVARQSTPRDVICIDDD